MIRVTDTRRRVSRIATKPLALRTQKALSLLKLSRAEVSLLLCGDRRMRSLNKRYRGIDKTTDVLSFPMQAAGSLSLPAGDACLKPGPSPSQSPGQKLLGDIVISIPTACRQAKQSGHSLKNELDRLIVHGLLHLVGYDHEKNAYQARKMRSKERELLEALSAG